GADVALRHHVVHRLVGASKPAPDIFEVALEKLELDPDRTLVVGDTVWDLDAAGKLGLEVVCVLTGGHQREELEKRGALAVYEDVAELLEHFDESPLGKLLNGD
ncbi:MAG TPA: HAD-IA family hydrolase, partial [Acidimicrobiales bacterium]|nr:HAD-IA family hydrolase [Acidimicrobiales bacterium]